MIVAAGGGDICELRKRESRGWTAVESGGGLLKREKRVSRSLTFTVGGGDLCGARKHKLCCWTSVISRGGRLGMGKRSLRVPPLNFRARRHQLWQVEEVQVGRLDVRGQSRWTLGIG